MLKQRVITALILMAILLPTLAVQALWPFSLFSLLFVSAGGWEWGRLNDASGWKAWALALAVAGLSLEMATLMGLPVWAPAVQTAAATAWGWPASWQQVPAGFVLPSGLWWSAALIWVPGMVLMLGWGATFWRRVAPALRALLGLVLLVLAWLALTEAKQQGLNFLLSVLCLVWAADIGAYFGGRRFGRRKLAPSISPGKSWEGVWSGALAVLLLAVLWMAFDRHFAPASTSFYTRLWQAGGVTVLLPALLFLTGMSVAGDLFESLVKRQAGEKDSSQLLPGHGGVLDRIDALLPVLPLSLAVLACALNWSAA